MSATRAKATGITTPENQAFTAEFNPTNPLEQGLGDRFFWSFFLAPPLNLSDCNVNLLKRHIRGYAGIKIRSGKWKYNYLLSLTVHFLRNLSSDGLEETMEHACFCSQNSDTFAEG